MYVGQQTWGKTPRNLTSAQRNALRKQNDCAADLLSEEEGLLNADDAVQARRGGGFSAGARSCFSISSAPRTFRRRCATTIGRGPRACLASHKYKPGIYTHQHNAAEIFTDVKNVFTAAGDTTTPRFWIAGGKNFNEGRAPQDVGFAFAGMWQGVIDVARSVANVRLPVDVNVSSWMSPSESGTSTK